VSGPLSILDYRQPVEFRIGDVFVKTWGVLTRHFVTFFLLVGIAELPFLAASGWLQEGARPGTAFRWTFFLISVGALFVQLFLTLFAQAVVVFAAFQDLRGKAVTVGESLMQALRRFLPVIGLAFMMALVLILGFMLCLVPGLIALAALQVALPACVVERLGPIRSMSRSTDLTSGHWWPILGLLVAFYIVSLLVSTGIRQALPFYPVLPFIVASWVWSVLGGCFSSVFTAILYHDLRAVKEGIGIEQIASVFD
jgi:hypothetical protein